jgi:isopenicillin-N N-acyltransferase-like protein
MITRVMSSTVPCHTIQTSFDTYTWLFREAAGVEWDEVRSRSTNWQKSIEYHAPELLQQLDAWASRAADQGVAIAGRPVDTTDLVALNARSEILASVWSTPSECTTVANQSNAVATIGQTWDWFGQQRDALVLLDIDADLVGGALTLTEAGMLAKIGINGAGLCVGLNFLSSAAGPAMPSSDNGWVVPVHVMLRMLLTRCRSIAECRDLLGQVQTSAGANITLADAEGNIAMLECMPASIPVEVEPSYPNWWVHTNHCINQQNAVLQGDLSGAFDESNDRYMRAIALVGASQAAADTTSSIVSILSDTDNGYHAISQRPNPALAASDRTETVVGVVMASTTTGASIRVAAGRPDDSRFSGPLFVQTS